MLNYIDTDSVQSHANLVPFINNFFIQLFPVLLCDADLRSKISPTVNLNSITVEDVLFRTSLARGIIEK